MSARQPIRERRPVKTVYRLLLALVTAAVISGCGYVPYQSEAVQGALFVRDLDPIATLGPAEYPGAEEDELAAPEEYHPAVSFSRRGFAVIRQENDLSILHVSDTSAAQIGSLGIAGTQLAERYVARAINSGEPPEESVSPLLLIAVDGEGGVEGSFGPARFFDDRGEISSVSLPGLLTDAFGGEEPAIVGAYAYASESAEDRLAVLARDRDSASFREAHFSLTAGGAISGPEYPAEGIFSLANLTDDVRIYNGGFVHDPNLGYSYFTVKDDDTYITYRWVAANPGESREEFAIQGIVDYATPEGTVVTREGGTLRRYDEAGAVVEESEAGKVFPAGLYWNDAQVQELFADIGVSRGIPDNTITVELLAR